MARRGNGEGSIVKRKDGRWQGSIVVGRDASGKLIRKTVYGKTRQEVQEALNKISGQLYSKTYIEPSSIELGCWLKDWLRNYKSISLKPTTYDLYETLIDKIIIPEIGSLKLKDIRPIHLQMFYNKLYDNGNGYSTSTLQKINNILSPACEVAVRNDLIVKNPMDGVQLPKHKEKQVRALTVEEEARFLEAAKNNQYYMAFVVLLDTGLRCGELLALTWDDIDLKNGMLYVSKNLVAVKDRITGKQKLVVQDTPKTSNAIRAIPLTTRALTLLKSLKLKRQSKTNIVFCTNRFTYIYPKNLRRAFQCVLKRAGIEQLGLHVLRHTFATRLFEKGANPKTVSTLLGHANVGITLDIYTHVEPEQMKEAIRLLESTV